MSESYLIKVDAVKEEKIDRLSPYDVYSGAQRVNPKPHQLYSAVQEYLALNGFDVVELSVTVMKESKS